MSKFRKIAWVIIGAELILFVLCNVLYWNTMKKDGQRLYRVEAERVAESLRSSNMDMEELDLTEFSTIIGVSEFDGGSCNYDYVVENINGTWYRIEYRVAWADSLALSFNLAFFSMIAVTLFVLWYVYKKILTPFDNMQRLPAELAKGNLAVPIKEEKNKFFGRFLWGMDMLRETLEEKKERELELKRQQKTLVLSLSHDIKTPLSAIELYAKALADDLYDTGEKRGEALEGITRNAREIQNYVNEITKVSREDFLNLEVQNGEFYLSGVLSFIKKYYEDKLAVLHTEFVLEQEADCILKGDRDRLIEVLQNLMENAVKYGDGTRISVLFDEEEDCKLITVENTGAGPDSEELPHLFDAFYRGSNHKNVKGSGLGLYICKHLMEKMDGDIFVKPEEGTFSVTLVVRKA